MHIKHTGWFILTLMTAGIAADAASSDLSERAISDFVAKAGVDHIWHTDQLHVPDNEWYISSYAIPHQLTPDICSTQLVHFQVSPHGRELHLYGAQTDLAVAFKSCSDASPVDFHDVVGGDLNEREFLNLFETVVSIMKTGGTGSPTISLNFESESEKNLLQDLSVKNLVFIEMKTNDTASISFVVKVPSAELLIFKFVRINGQIYAVYAMLEDALDAE